MNPQPATQDSFGAVHDWATATGLLDRAHSTGEIPPAGSVAWSRLSDQDPRKPAAVVRAALVWLHQGTREAITARLSAELDLIDRMKADSVKTLSTDLSAAADWSQRAAGPTRRELIRRRHHRPPCPHCSTALGWTDTTCPECGWTEPTPAQIRADAAASWARYNTTTEAAA